MTKKMLFWSFKEREKIRYTVLANTFAIFSILRSKLSSLVGLISVIYFFFDPITKNSLFPTRNRLSHFFRKMVAKFTIFVIKTELAFHTQQQEIIICY